MRVVAGVADQGKRLDLFLAAATGQSRNRIAQLIREGLVTIDTQPAKASYRVEDGEEIEVGEAPPLTGVKPNPLPLDVAYEDTDLVVLNKSRGLVVHPAVGHAEDTLVNALWARYGDLPGEGFRAGLIHRLDKDTTGLLVVAKTQAAMEGLQRQLAAREIHREYLALVHGSPPTERGRIEAPIGRDPRHRQRFAVFQGGREAVTHFQVRERFNGFSLLELQLETGRTHQIRVHLSHLGWPVLGDPLYGPVGGTGQLLHAWRLSFTHPVTGAEVSCEVAPPADFAAVLERLRRGEGPIEG